MRALLDTNIIIHRENTKATNYSIGKLFYWLDKLHFEKVIHPFTEKELRKYDNSQMQSLYDAKLSAYTVMKTISTPKSEFTEALSEAPKTDNDIIDNQLLLELYNRKVDILITEDRKMLLKAERLNLADKVYTINAFITKAASENPDLIDYKVLAVKKEYFGDIDVQNSFFDTFRDAYDGFDDWYIGKSDEEAYVCYSDTGDILGFLYIKPEDETENYSDISPVFAPKKRLKVGTFKVEASGFRLGERFIKIIFDNAIERKVDEIYVTLFVNRPELRALYDLLCRWGFCKYGTKTKNGKVETVLVKKLGEYNNELSIKENFPNIDYSKKKLILPIEAVYHTPLLPDSILKNENEVDFLGKTPHRYALQKVYVSFSYKRNMSPGDILVLYRKGVNEGRKAFESVITTIGIIDEVKYNFDSKEEFINYCGNRTVFSQSELNSFWNNNKERLLVVKFIFVKDLKKRLTLGYLWDNNIVDLYKGPRPFDEISDNDFKKIIEDSETNLYFL
jgi:predicted nucleic acid-binding protein